MAGSGLVLVAFACPFACPFAVELEGVGLLVFSSLLSLSLSAAVLFLRTPPLLVDLKDLPDG